MTMTFRFITTSMPFLLTDKKTGKTFLFIIASYRSASEGYYRIWLFVNCTPKEALQFEANIYLDHAIDKPTLFSIGPKTAMPVISINFSFEEVLRNKMGLKISCDEFFNETAMRRGDRLFQWKVQIVDS